MRETYFHEDDYCQVEVLPATNYEFCRNQLGEIESFSTKHDTGFGWTDMFIRSDAPTELKSAGLLESEVESELATYLPKYDRVFTGYSTYREECKNTIAFGVNDNFVMYADIGHGVVTKLWLTIYGLQDSDIANAQRLIDYLSRSHLMLVDWSMSAIVAFADSNAVGQYLLEFQADPDTEQNA